MTMGEAGMADMGDMEMKMPRNSVPMVGAPGRHDYITTGGMYTNIKVRPDLASYDPDPGWDQQPPDTLATLAAPERMKRNLGFIPDAAPANGDGGHQHHHG